MGTYLGCQHVRASVKLTSGSEVRCLLYDMQAFFVTCLAMYEEHAKRANPQFKFKLAATPVVEDACRAGPRGGNVLTGS